MALQGKDLEAVLLYACEDGDLETFQQCIDKEVVLHDAHANLKDTPIFKCCYHGNTELMRCIVDRNPNVLLQPTVGEIGECPVAKHNVIWHQLSNNRDENHILMIGSCLLYLACIQKDLQTVKYITSKMMSTNENFNSNFEASSTKQPLYIACINDDIDMARFFVDKNAEITKEIVEQFPGTVDVLLRSYVKPHERTWRPHKKRRFTIRKTLTKKKNATRATKIKSITKKKQGKKQPSAEDIALTWNGLRLHALEEDWFRAYQHSNKEIRSVNISDNKITSLPDDFFEVLSNLEELDVSRNSLVSIPTEGIENAGLISFFASQNKLNHLPVELFHNRTIQTVDVSDNSIDNLSFSSPLNHDDAKRMTWKCTSLETLKCSNNSIQTLPAVMQGAVSLMRLLLNHNKFKSFDFVWKCPMTTLNLSNNHLEQFPGRLDEVWSRSLQSLVVSHNKMNLIPACITRLQSMKELDLSYNSLFSLPRTNAWKCKMLSKLNLSHNKLSTRDLSEGFVDVTDSGHDVQYDKTCDFPVKLFTRTLQVLDLSHNELHEVPPTICDLKVLGELDLSNNPDLHYLPPSLGLLSSIWDLRLNNLDISNIPFKLDNYNQVKKVLPFLRAKFRKSVPFNRMKLMIVGLQGRGKTSLVAAIQGKSLPDDISTVGISIEKITLPLKQHYGFWGGSNQSEIVFSTWDLAGQQVYYATHQCFLTGNTLYLVVFNVTHGNEGIEALKPWLLNIQARAPNSQCIVVGTHTDCLPDEFKEFTIQKYRNDIERKYSKKGYPEIAEYAFVSSVTGEGIEQLQDFIYSIAKEMIHKNSTESDVGKTAPLSYLQLYDRIILENHQRRLDNCPPILTTCEMLKLAQENPDNDIFEGEELFSAARFLHENGVLLHFDDPLRGLNSLFFIDPSWLVDMLALVVTVKQRNPYVQDGYIDQDKMMTILREPRLPVTYIDQYLRLLERFEIALVIDDVRFLVPCMLPFDKPDITDKMHHFNTYEEIVDQKVSSERNTNYLTRNYHMNYIPAGFWSRLIARLAIAVQEWDSHGKQCAESLNKTAPRCSYIVWKEGIFVTYEDGYFLVESFLDDMLDYNERSNQGMTIMVWSKTQRFNTMAFIVDIVDTLLSSWYPGLADEYDDHGNELIQKMTPCPLCSFNTQESVIQNDTVDRDYIRKNYGSLFRDPLSVHQFSLRMCASASLEYKYVYCEKHPDDPVPLHLVIPDIMLTDIPKEFQIDKELFDFDAKDENRLGEGGVAEVFKATYRGARVAVKRNFFSESSHEREQKQSTLVFTPDLEERYCEGQKIISKVWEMRLEVLVLCTLQHRNIIEFLGVCHSPLVFVIELAPLGSLQDITEDLVQRRKLITSEASSKEMEWLKSIFGRGITHSLALQVIEAIKYLHSFNIVFRDLKSDNILVFSIKDQDNVNVKISDFGTATFLTPQGIVGDIGTPGFQSPEMKSDSPYDEKVDIFAYGMWLYQIISGYTPLHEYKTPLEIKKAVSAGIRPNLQKDSIRSKLPNLELLMETCWDNSPVLRPSASDISLFLGHSDSCMMEVMYPSQTNTSIVSNVSCLAVWNVQLKEDTEACDVIVSWIDAGDDRKYQIIDFADETLFCEGILPGAQVLCACQVEENMWLFNKDNEIEVLGYTNLQSPKILWKSSIAHDEIIKFLLHNAEDYLCVLGCSANGNLYIYKKMIADTTFEETLFDDNEEEIISSEKDQWLTNSQVIKLNAIGSPSKCMTVTKNNTELWVGSGDNIVVLTMNNANFQIDAHLSVNTSSPLSSQAASSDHSVLSCMTSDGENTVWVSSWRSTVVIKWDVTSRTPVCQYQCNVKQPLNSVLYSNIGDRESQHCKNRSFPLEEVFENSDVTNKDKTVKFDVDDCDGRLRATSLIQFPNRVMKKTTLRSKSTSSKLGSVTIDDTVLISSYARRIKTLEYVNGALWVGRALGDILILSVVDTPLGEVAIKEAQVLSVLVHDNLEMMGGFTRSVHSMEAMDSHMAVLMRKNERTRQRSVRNRSYNEKKRGSHTNLSDTFQVILYELWNPEQIAEFNDRINRMVTD